MLQQSFRYIARDHHGHEKRLKRILDIRSLDNSFTPFAIFDALYLQIFKSVGEDEINKFMEILSALIFLNDTQIQRELRNVNFLEEFIDCRLGELETTALT